MVLRRAVEKADEILGENLRTRGAASILANLDSYGPTWVLALGLTGSYPRDLRKARP